MSGVDEASLAAVLALRWGGPVEVTGLRRLSGGASRETWSFDARDGGGELHPLVIQRERPGGMRSAVGMGPEGDLLRAAAAAGVPVAPVVVTDGDLADRTGAPDLGGPYLVMGRVEGETIPRRVLRDPELAHARSRLARQVGSAMAAVHRIDPTGRRGLSDEDPLEQYRNLLSVLGEPHPAFELGLRWLEEHRPARSGPPVVVHGDLRMGNLVVGADGLRAVLDWELAHLGDPVEDLGWFCVRAWRFGSPLRAGGVGPVEDLLAGYVEGGGRPVGADELRWWEAFGVLRWGVICMVQAAAHLSGASRSVELAAIGRRTAQCEEDLLQLVSGDSPYVPVAATGARVPDPPHDRPTAAELLDAVGDYLVEVRDGVDGRLGFHARVAANVVAVVRRELELGPDQARAHAARLAELGVADDAELAAAVRDGRLDGRLDEVTRTVRAAVRDKLAVADPGYWEPDR